MDHEKSFHYRQVLVFFRLQYETIILFVHKKRRCFTTLLFVLSIITSPTITEQKQDRVQLTITAIEYKSTKNYLERLVKKIENLLRLLLICNKYETLNENIYSYGNYEESSTREIITTFELKESAEVGYYFESK